MMKLVKMMAVLVEYHILHVLQDMVSSFKSPDFLIFFFKIKIVKASDMVIIAKVTS